MNPSVLKENLPPPVAVRFEPKTLLSQSEKARAVFFAHSRKRCHRADSSGVTFSDLGRGERQVYSARSSTRSMELSSSVPRAEVGGWGSAFAARAKENGPNVSSKINAASAGVRK